jgi:Lon protease-like protein
LVPGARIPLHVFEPRYRQMVARCIEYDGRFGLLFHSDARYGPFRVESGRVGCVAEIKQFEPLPDGRSLLVSEGLGRFRIEDGIESAELYHEALVEDYVDEAEDPRVVVGRRHRSIELFRQVLRALKEDGELARGLDAAQEVSFSLAAAIEIDASWQQGLLELRRETQRLARIDEVTRRLLTVLRSRDEDR